MSHDHHQESPVDTSPKALTKAECYRDAHIRVSTSHGHDVLRARSGSKKNNREFLKC